MRILYRSLAVSLVLAAAPLFAAEKNVGTGASFKGPIGLQLYSLRAEFAKDLPATLDKVKSYGIKYVETAGTYNLAPVQFKEMLESRGLQPVSGHFPYDRYRDDIEGVAKDAKALGLKYAGCAWITHQGDFTEKDARDAAAVFNKAGEVLAKSGIKFFYHTHGYEFQPYKEGTLLDLLMTETKPELVRFEMDVFWIVHPGQDPVKLLEKYPKRFELMHVKDMKKGTKGDLTGHSDVKNDVALGTGLMDWPAILKAAKQAGVKYYFIEDESPTAAQQIPQSLKFLEQVKF
jgi:sugar phosphate isomerase/epimerase